MKTKNLSESGSEYDHIANALVTGCGLLAALDAISVIFVLGLMLLCGAALTLGALI